LSKQFALVYILIVNTVSLLGWSNIFH